MQRPSFIHCKVCVWCRDGECWLDPPIPIVSLFGLRIKWRHPPVDPSHYCKFGERLLTEEEKAARPKSIRVPRRVNRKISRRG